MGVDAVRHPAGGDAVLAGDGDGQGLLLSSAKPLFGVRRQSRAGGESFAKPLISAFQTDVSARGRRNGIRRLRARANRGVRADTARRAAFRGRLGGEDSGGAGAHAGDVRRRGAAVLSGARSAAGEPLGGAGRGGAGVFGQLHALLQRHGPDIRGNVGFRNRADISRHGGFRSGRTLRATGAQGERGGIAGLAGARAAPAVRGFRRCWGCDSRGARRQFAVGGRRARSERDKSGAGCVFRGGALAPRGGRRDSYGGRNRGAGVQSRQRIRGAEWRNAGERAADRQIHNRAAFARGRIHVGAIPAYRALPRGDGAHVACPARIRRRADPTRELVGRLDGRGGSGGALRMRLRAVLGAKPSADSGMAGFIGIRRGHNTSASHSEPQLCGGVPLRAGAGAVFACHRLRRREVWRAGIHRNRARGGGRVHAVRLPAERRQPRRGRGGEGDFGRPPSDARNGAREGRLSPPVHIRQPERRIPEPDALLLVGRDFHRLQSRRDNLGRRHAAAPRCGGFRSQPGAARRRRIAHAEQSGSVFIRFARRRRLARGGLRENSIIGRTGGARGVQRVRGRRRAYLRQASVRGGGYAGEVLPPPVRGGFLRLAAGAQVSRFRGFRLPVRRIRDDFRRRLHGAGGYAGLRRFQDRHGAIHIGRRTTMERGSAVRRGYRRAFSESV